MAVPHISQPPVPKSRGLTASPLGEKPCPLSNAVRIVAASEDFHQRLLPRGWCSAQRIHNLNDCRGQSYLDSEAVKNRFPKNRFLTDVGDRRRRLCNLVTIQNGPVAKFATGPFLGFMPVFGWRFGRRRPDGSGIDRRWVWGSGPWGPVGNSCATRCPGG